MNLFFFNISRSRCNSALDHGPGVTSRLASSSGPTINPNSLLLPLMLKEGRSTKIGIETGIEIRSGPGLAPTVEPELATKMWPRSRLKLTAKSADVEHEGIHSNLYPRERTLGHI
ncbi:hypothetical protein EVAR_70828_1 [Eumeta japonica]|uniref:Uncharacterized protein n=1 Tax=Eumeta variegata TaxID=151549 RepID=A0A4C2ACI1_EUMVA|nr:hypothetical protein EVAR_70828_1 [Eumeta japonica]